MRNAIYLLFAAFSAFMLGIGWCGKYAPLGPPARSYLLSLHVSLGLTAAALILALSLLRSLFLLLHFAPGGQQRKRVLGDRFYPILFTTFIVMLVTGFFQASLGALPIRFWNVPLLAGTNAEKPYYAIFAAIHKIGAYALAALILVYAAITIANMVRRRERATAMVPALPAGSTGAVPGGPRHPRSFAIAQSLAHKLRFGGRAAFWVQLILALLSAPLLAIGASGRTISSGAGFGEIYCGIAGLALLFLATVSAFFFKRTAKRIVVNADPYLGLEAKALAFWFLGAGTFTGVLGALASFIGVGLSVLLLIAKTVSQPPGIAITDPSKIVRALDVLVLIVNCNLVVAHAMGIGVSVWLSINVLRARQAYQRL